MLKIVTQWIQEQYPEFEGEYLSSVLEIERYTAVGNNLQKLEIASINQEIFLRYSRPQSGRWVTHSDAFDLNDPQMFDKMKTFLDRAII